MFRSHGGKHMKYIRRLNAALIVIAAVTGMATAANATIAATIIIPDTEVVLNFNDTGLDWVYAGPIAPNEFGPGQIQPASYRAAEGWRVATASEWLLHPIWSDFTRVGFATPSPSGGFSDHSSYRFTSEYWSDFTHVDLSDFAAGIVTDGVNGVTSGVPETIYVRSSLVAAVPEPGTWAMMLLGFGAVGSSMRRKRKSELAQLA